ncbi:hypothetical protein [Adhaeribacter soli]|uniref:Uncharacterized protein n=1 Tax=Adhaeribacter soli TaxID=2607655 RepID=A0A5N1J691_9BACT|nr:hypothetical protein [Adhaeribacter soli]KAA9340113.1 hypothetical protein F0P94_07125 [Adhaeribacter soli]
MEIPAFRRYYATERDMTSAQLVFYKEVKKSLSKGTYINVDGNISYVFAYTSELLANWGEKGFENLSEFLLYLSELYFHEKDLSDYCKYWAYDCLLGLGKYEEYLEKTEPQEAYGTLTHMSNLRLNIQRHINVEANPLDLLLMAGGRKTKIIKSNHILYKDKVRKVFSEYGSNNGGWFKIFEKWQTNFHLYEHSLFNGAPIWNSPKINLKTECFYSINEYLNLSKELSKTAENQTREDLGIPLIGEGWVSETELFRKLETHFAQTKVMQHGQPIWLGRQHYDIWFLIWKIAIEYHGKQHFEPVEFFGGEVAYLKNVERDERKIKLSKKNGIKFIVVTEGYHLSDVITEIETHISKRNITSPN